MLRQRPEARILRLNSRGGRIGEAYKLRDIIGPRGMTTYTSSGCYSACTDVFLAGKERVVHQDARLGFHRPGLPGVWASLWDGEVEADARAMLATGVEPTFVARATATPNA